MPRSKFVTYRSKYDNNRPGTSSQHEERGSTPPINRDPERRSATKNHYHPYQRNNKRGKNDQQSQNRDQNNRQCFSDTYLRKLSKMSSDECVAELAGKKTQFDQLLNDVFRPDLLVVTVQVLANICRANFTEIVTSVLSHACSAPFLKSLESYLTKLPFESDNDKLSNELYWTDKNGFWNNLMQLFKKITELFPNKACEELVTVLGKTNSIITTTESYQDYTIDENIKDAILKIYNELKEEMQKFEARSNVKEPLSDVKKTEDPPEDFRSLSVVPTIDDLNDQNPFIRPCKLKGAYDSVEHYLDVQFRLLREDFIAPLRAGIEEYLHGPKKYRNTQLRIYKKVTLINPEEAGNKFGVMVSFGKLKYVNWNNSKRFLFGGLLCLSSDNFNTILFATVADRDEKLLKNGKILIEPCKDTPITCDSYHSNWIMLESKIYFEPYLVVLNAMRQMNQTNFPMKKYLVDADTCISLPQYLKPLISDPDKISVLKYKGFELPIGENQVWPSPEKLQLDDTQYEAFKSALSQEFAVIQGPPGTGKTFIALELICTLLENRSYWRDAGPIVIVCLTNHALDQFLEGILEHTSSVVRLGSRSKSQALSNCTLVERRRTLSSVRKCDRSYAVKMINHMTYEANCILSDIERTRTASKYLRTKDAVVPLNLLSEYCNDKKVRELKNYDALLQWLLEDSKYSMEQDSTSGLRNTDNTNEIEEDSEDDEIRSINGEAEWIPEVDPNDHEPLVFLLESIDAYIAEKQEMILNYKRPRNNSRFSLYYKHQFDPFEKLKSEIKALQSQRSNLQRNLSQHPLRTSQEKEKLNPSPRWQTYWKWVKRSYEKVSHKLVKLEEEYQKVKVKLNEAKQMVDLDVLRKYDIIGFTTTTAARLHMTLRALHAPIVLVEEAAEILEAHVVCSLTESCQHVILIGDHKQLRPKAAVHELGAKYNLNISLFERMVNNRGTCAQLAHQHRMRPEIASLICPSIYKTLHNHQSVLEYPSILGLEKNLFFINHTNREESRDNDESWINPHEAKFLVAFARHLILQGYKSTEITILCTYTGQLFTLIEERSYYSILKDVRITTIDNYQGEENRIILLSLVRNNEKGNIGFLKEENRVCVALSRAREGLYIMGNMDNLTKKNDIWPKIKTVLEDTNAIGDSLQLRCKFHVEKSIIVQQATDFEQCPEGGCLQKCEADLPCGHTCTSICHISDRAHMNFTCRQPCVKRCPDDHPCPLICYQECEPCLVTVDRQLKCGHTAHISCATDPNIYPCPVQVDAVLPLCGHAVQKACYLPLEECPCSHRCEIRLPCGHSCGMNCHINNDPDHLEYVCRKPCSKSNSDCTMSHPCKLQCHENCIPCPVVVEKKRSCGHTRQLACSGDVEKMKCQKRLIEYKKSCGHKLTVRCCEKDYNCLENVTKTSPCGHKVQVKCYEIPSVSQCRGKCKRILECGHPCTARCKDPCTKRCNTLVPQTERGLCGHIISIPCHLKETEVDSPALLKYCKEPCKALLVCGHICKGDCSSCKQGRIHNPCGEICGNILICGHGCEVPCRERCPPCEKPCQVKCVHSKCNKKCGEPCTPCMEPCAAKCVHSRCMKRCSELCIRKPCMKPCRKLSKCKHPCIGFCGEPCPQLCRVCDKEALINEFFIGHEDEPDARFVLLEDCGHCIESQGLLKWTSQCSESIQMKTCPRCKTPISKCMRLSNQIKTDFKDIQLVKKKIFGDPLKLRLQQRKLISKTKDIMKNRIPSDFKSTQELLENLDASVAFVTRAGKLQILNAQAAEATQIVLNILEEVFDKFEKIKNHNVSSYTLVKDQINMLLESLPRRGQISTQEIEDIELELRRLDYMVEICVIESQACLGQGDSDTDQKLYTVITQKLRSIVKFCKAVEEEITNDVNELKVLLEMNVAIKNERKMIVKAMGFKQGHWYKCPKGHIYSIGECGGAMQQSKCNECGSAIGGQSHRLASGNSVATEMDGATHSAWPGGR